VLSVQEYEEIRISFLEFCQLAEGLMNLRKGKAKLVDFKEALEKLLENGEMVRKLQEVER